MLNIVNVGYDSTNYYVIETAATKLLVDVGFPGTLPKLQHALKRTGIALPSIAYLLVTHYHPDHAGLAQELKQQGLKLIVLKPQVGADALVSAQPKRVWATISWREGSNGRLRARFLALRCWRQTDTLRWVEG